MRLRGKLLARSPVRGLEAWVRQWLWPSERIPSTPAVKAVQALQSEPSQFSRFPKELSVIKPTAADANAIARQRVCPVMDEPLDAMGGPYRVNAAGRIIYICCPGCAGRISSDPSKYVAKLRERGIEAPRIR